MRLTEKDILKKLQESAPQYEPLRIGKIETEVFLADKINADAAAEVAIDNGTPFKALIAVRTVANPMTIILACKMLRNELELVREQEFVPMIIAPYIGDKQADILADEGVSWIDLCGNMRIKIPNQVYIERTGRPNKYPDSVPIKKIFEGTSSLVTRALLLQPEGFSSLSQIVDFINSRNSNITLSTVSKVLNSLEQELYIDKSKSLIRVRKPVELLEKLAESYKISTERKTRKSYKFSVDTPENFFDNLFEQQIDYAICGFYAAQLKGLAVSNEITVFVKDIADIRKAAGRGAYAFQLTPDSEFGNLVITESDDAGVWFNAVKQTNPSQYSVVDDIELYLEMTTDTPRGPKIAEVIRENILRRFNG
jgi:hypothetical protein